MKVLSRILVVFLLAGTVYSCRPPGADYKLSRAESRRIHQDHVYYRTRADRKMEEEKLARKEKEKERLEHNLRVANSRNPIKQIQIKPKNQAFNHH